MKIAVPYENGEVFGHFGHTETFKLYEIEGGQIAASQICPTNGSGHGALADFLHELGAEVLICGGIGGGARMALARVGIAVYGGVYGDADAAAEAFLDNTLDYDPNAACSHQEGAHAHNCGEDHHCGGHCGG